MPRSLRLERVNHSGHAMEFGQRNIPPEPGTPENEKDTETIFPHQETSNRSMSSSPQMSDVSTTFARNTTVPRNLLHTPPTNLDECKEQLQTLREQLRSHEEESLTGLFIHTANPQNPFLKGVHGPAFLGDSTARFFGMQLKFEVNSRMFTILTLVCCYACIHLYRLLLVWLYEDIQEPTSKSSSCWDTFSLDSPPALTFVLTNQIFMFMLIVSISFYPFLHQLQSGFRNACMFVLECLLIIAATLSFIFATQGSLPNSYFYIADIALLLAFSITNAYIPLQRDRRPFWIRDFIFYILTVVLTTVYIFLAPIIFHSIYILSNSNSIRMLVIIAIPLVSDVMLGIIRLASRTIDVEESEKVTLHSLALPIYATMHITLGVACLSFSDVAMVALSSTLSNLQINFMKYILFYRDVIPMKIMTLNANPLSSKGQIRFTADFTLLEHLSHFCGVTVACIIFLVFNLANDSTSTLVLKCFVCVILHTLFSQLPILAVCGCGHLTADATNTSINESSSVGDVEVGPGDSWSKRFWKTCLMAIRRRHCDFVNVWCSKHDDFRKYFLFAMVGATMIFLRILFDPLQYLCLENRKRFLACV